MNILLKVSVFVLQSNSCISIIKGNLLNQISYIKQLQLKLLENPDSTPIVSRLIAEVSHKKQWYELPSVQSNLGRKESPHQPQMLWVTNRDNVGVVLKKLFINDHFLLLQRL